MDSKIITISVSFSTFHTTTKPVYKKQLHRIKNSHIPISFKQFSGGLRPVIIILQSLTLLKCWRYWILTNHFEIVVEFIHHERYCAGDKYTYFHDGMMNIMTIVCLIMYLLQYSWSSYATTCFLSISSSSSFSQLINISTASVVRNFGS